MTKKEKMENDNELFITIHYVQKCNVIYSVESVCQSVCPLEILPIPYFLLPKIFQKVITLLFIWY